MKSLVPGFLKKRDDKYVGARTSMKLDSGTVIPFIDLLETAVRKKAKSPAVSLKLLDNKQTTEVIDHFSNGFRNRISLDKNDTNVLWSAAIKIIKMSDPIFSDRNCTTLQTANAQDVSNIASFLPVHHQQLLGALLSASEMIIRIDNNSANLAADTLSSVLIWNSAPGSLMNRHAFCNLINNQRHDFPYCHSFERKLNLTVAPLSSDEWIAILEITAADLTTFEDRRRRLVEPIVSDRVEVLDEKPTISSLTAADSIQNFSILTPASIPVDSSLVLADVSKISRANNSTISALDISHGTDRSSNVVSANEVVGPSNKSNLGCVPKDTLSAKPKTRSESTTLQTLQIVFQRCFITRDDLVDLRLRQIDLDEDYADLSSLLDALDEEMAPKELVSIVEYSRLKSVSQGVVAWTELLQLAMPFLSSEEQERVRKERIEFATSRSGEARIAMQGIPESPLKRLQSSFDDDEIEEVQEKVTLPKAVISRAKDEWSKEESKGKENSGYNSFDEDDTIEELPTVYESKPTKSDADKPSESKRHSQEEEKLSEFVRVNRQTWGKDSKDESKPRVMDSWESEKQDSWGKKDAWNKAKGRREVVRESVGSNSVLTDSMDEESIQDALSSQELPRGQGRDKSLSSYYDDGDDQKLDEKKGGANIGMAKNTGDWHSEDDEDIDEKETSKLGVKPFTGDRANIADKVERDISRENQTGKERLASASFETSMTEDKNRAATTSEVGQVDVTKREVDERMNKDGERERVHDEYGIKLVDDGGDDEANKPSWKRRETVGVAKKSQTFQLTSAELDSTLSTPTTSPVKRSVMELLYEYQGKPEAEESKGGNAEDNKQNTSNDVLGQTTSSKSPRKLPSDTGFKKQLSSKSSVRSLLSSSYNLLAHLGESKEKKEEDEESVMSSTDSRIDPNELNVLDRNTYLLKKAAKMSAKRQSAQSLVNRKVVTEKEEEKKTSGVLGLFGKKNDDAEANKGDRSRGLFSKVKHAFVFASRSSSPATRASLDSSSGGGPESIQAPKDLPDSAVFKPSETQSSRPPSPLIPNQPSGEPLEGVESKEAQSSSLVDGSKDSAGAGRDLLLSGNDVKNTGGASGGSFVQQSILIEPSLRKPIKKRDWDTAAPVSELTNAPAPTESGSVQTLLDYRPDESTAIATQDEDKEDAPRPTHRPLPPIPVSAPPTLEEISGNMHKDIPTAQKRLSNPALRRANSEQKVGELTYNAHSSSVPVSIPSCAPDPTSLRSASPTSLNVSIAPAAAASGAASHTGLVKLDGRGLAQLIRNTYSMQDAQLFAPPALRGSLSMSFSAYPRSSSPNAHHPHVPFSQAALPRSSSPMPRGSAVRFSVASVGTQGEEDIEELVRDGEGEFGCEEVDGDGSGRGKGANKGADRLRKLIQRSQMVSNVTQELIRIVQTGGKTDEGPAYVSLPVRFSVGTSAASTTQSVAVPRETILPTVWQQLLAIQQKTPWRPPVKSADSLLAYAEQIEEQSKQGELIASLLQYKDSLEPKSVYLTPKQIEEMQNLACLHGRIACDKRVGWRAAKEAKLLSKFGTSSQKSSMVTLQVPAYALKLFRPPSSLSFHDRKSFYSELHLAWGVRFAGKVKKNVPRAGFLRRYFVLVCNLRQNPNLIPPQSRFDLLTPEYHLLEYRDCLSSLWGEVAIGFKRGYCLTSQLSAIITEAKGGSKVGRDFTLVFNNWGGNYTVPIEDKRTGLAGIGADRVDVRSSSSTVKSAAGKSTPKSSLNRPQFLTMDLGGAGGGREGDEDSEDTGDRTWDGEGRNFAGRSRSAGAYSQTAESDRDSEAEENGEEDELEKEDEEVGHRFLERVTTLNAPSLPLSPPSASSTSPIPALRLPSEQQSILQPKDPKSHSPVFTVTLRAPSPSERLQWTQVLESVCPKGTFVNTVHY